MRVRESGGPAGQATANTMCHADSQTSTILAGGYRHSSHSLWQNEQGACSQFTDRQDPCQASPKEDYMRPAQNYEELRLPEASGRYADSC